MKTEFKLEKLYEHRYGKATLKIIGTAPENRPYVILTTDIPEVSDYCIKDNDLERFAINILKALKSKKEAQFKKEIK